MFVCLFSDMILYYIKYRLLCLQEIQENALIIINIKSHIAFYCLGEGWLEMCIRIDLDANTLSIYPQKLDSIYKEFLAISSSSQVTKKALQSSLGKILCIYKCIPPDIN